MSISKRLRYEVLRRDNHACRYCGAAAPDVALTVDHVVPTALGGSDDPANLVAACKDCNAGKSASAPDGALVADVEADALRWAAAIKWASHEQLIDHQGRQKIVEWFDQCWADWNYGDDKQALPRPPDWSDTILRFAAADLDFEVMHAALQSAMRNSRVRAADTWRYFCGICWRRVAEMQDMARSLIAFQDGGDPDGS